MRIGSLFSGYGGLDLAVMSVLGGELAWVADVEPGPRVILARHWPGVPNLGDVTTVDWSRVEPVDVITGGSPCQDLSLAGARRGMTAGTRSNLWVAMREAIAVLRPRMVVWENVRGALSAVAESEADCEDDLGLGAGLLGDGAGGPALRALGRVLGDLADLGFDAEWCGLRAAEVGAPHGRFRVFVVARAADPDSIAEERQRVGGSVGSASRDVAGQRYQREWCRGAAGDRGETALMPTPTVGDKGGVAARSSGTFGPPLGEVEHLLPTPRASRGASNTETVALLPTPTVSVSTGPGEHGDGGANLQTVLNRKDRFGEYAPAIARWERVLGRSAPAPTDHGRLSARFVEWMMGLPDGWVTGRGLSRVQELKMLGNGVVPQQAEAAILAVLGEEQV